MYAVCTATFHVLDLKFNLLYISHDYVKVISIMIVSMMIYENMIFHDCIKIIFNLPWQGCLREGGVI